MLSKKRLREELQLIRDNISPEMRKREIEIIKNSLISSELYKNAKSIFIYNSFRSEVNTAGIVNIALEESKKVALPIINIDEYSMRACEINLETVFIQDAYGISTPDISKSKIINPTEIDLAIVPLIAYDNFGNRLGYGAGYYDRYLPNLREDTVIMGLAFSNQLVEELPIEEHDKKLEYVVTVEYIENNAVGKIIRF